MVSGWSQPLAFSLMAVSSISSELQNEWACISQAPSSVKEAER